jgi:hypothetical protein
VRGRSVAIRTGGWRAVAAVALATLVAASLGTAAVERRDRAAAPRGVPLVEAPDAGAALLAANRQGSPVEALDLRTETRAVYAEPDGKLRAEVYARPVRAKRADGSWSPVDTTLVQRPDGTVGPRSATVDIAFSGGGAKAPLVRYGGAKGWLALSWPGRLPAPVLSGDTATYAEVLPGVDLRLTADVDGYAQYLVVKDRAAASNPALRSVRLGLKTGGVTVRSTRAGALEVRDAKGAVLFSAPVSRMWDSGTPRREAAVDVAVEKGALVVRPDRALLTGASTKYPVTVDPLFHTADKHRWTSVLQGNPGTPYPNSSGSPPWAQVGQCYTPSGQCNGIGLAHTYWMFDTSFLSGRLVITASLRIVAVNSPNCETRTHQVYKAAADIHDGTSWNTKPAGLSNPGPVNFTAPAVNSGCPGAKEVGIGVASQVNRGGTTTFLVQPADPNDQIAWRRYENNAKLTVQFNRVPDVPKSLGTDPPLTPCHWCGGVPYAADDNVRLMATLTDPDGDQVQSVWQVKVGGQTYSSESAFQNNGAVHSYDVGTANRHNLAVEWAVKGEDTAQHGGDWATGTRFVIDREPPGVAPVVQGTPYLRDNRWHGGVGVPGKFTFAPLPAGQDPVQAKVTDIDHYLWGWSQPPTNKAVATALGGATTVTLTPPGDGPRDLFVQSVDRAGHRSATTQYHFYVRAGSGPLAQWSLDGNAEDDAFLGDRDGVVQGGVTYVPGAVGQAGRFDGTTGYITPPNTVRTDASFAVSAWVKLDSAGFARAAVSQSGTNFPGFAIWYRPEDGGRWGFGMPRSDASYQGTDMALSAQPAQVGVWTHLAGVYDAGDRSLRLYVDGALAGTAQRTVADWVVDGRVQIGRTMWNGSAGVDHWAGLLDEVKIYDRVVSAQEIGAAVGADEVQVGHWKLDELSGTTGSNEVAGGEMVALQGDAAFTGDSDGDQIADGGAVGGAVRLDGTGDHVATAGPVLHTNQGFTVAGWFQLDQAPQAGQIFTALSQDGTAISGFFLGYRQRTSDAVWEFSAPGADVTGGSGGAGIQSTSRAQTRVPTHVAAVYDAGARQIRLYINGELEATGTRADGFDATGPFVIGRGFNGGPSGHWNGWVDEVRAYSRALSAAEIHAVVSRDDVALGEWHLDGNAEGTGGTGALKGTPAWTGGQSDAPDPTDLAVRMSGDDHIEMPLTVDAERSFAVAAWAKLDQVGGTATVVSQDGTDTSLFQLAAIPDGRWSFGMSATGATGGTVDRVDGPEAQVGVWTHLVGIYDTAADQLSLYVNGVQAGSAKPHQQLLFPEGKLQIGGGLVGGNRQNRVIGAIDDVVVYGRVLRAPEIRAMAGRDLTLAHNWRLDEGSGTQAADAVGRRTATAAGGVTRVPGRLGNAVQFNGTDGRLATGGVDLATDADFTVTAWAYLDETCSLTPSQFECKLAAVSLDGTATGASKFRLGHRRDRNQHRQGVWFFEMPESNGDITMAAVPVLPSDFGKWVHLAGVYDKATGTLWLYVNGTRKGDGRLNQPWSTTGGLQIGRARDTTGTAGQYFTGTVDDVRLYSGALNDDRIRNLYGSYPVQCGTIENPVACGLPAADAGRWSFDEGTGTTVANSVVPDDPATMGGAATWTGGRIGKAGQFDGASGYARSTNATLNTAESFSVSAWVAAGATTPTANQVILSQAGTNASPFYLYREAGGRWAAATSTADVNTPTLVSATSAETVWPGQWTHLGLVYNATLSQLRLYVNGRLSAAQSGVTTWQAGGALNIARGRWGGQDTLYFQGSVDDVRVYQRALRDGEMVKVFDDTSPVEAGHWTLDGTLRDSSWRDNPTTGTGTISYVDGAVGRALALDGRSAAATSRPAVVPVSSLTVSAWVRLTYEPAVQSVVAQDGTRNSGFALQYRPELDTWVFGAWSQDTDAAEFGYARSGAAAVLGEWTHLTGVYDHAAGQLRLYVNGQLAGSQEGVTLFPATGAFTIGRGKYRGTVGQHLTGEIDDVRVDLGVVPDSEIAQRATRA